MQEIAVDLIQSDEHHRVGLVVRFQVKHPWVLGDQFVATLKANGHTDRVRLGAGMASLNGKYFTIDLERRSSIVAGFFGARKRQAQFANNVEGGALGVHAIERLNRYLTEGN